LKDNILCELFIEWMQRIFRLCSKNFTLILRAGPEIKRGAGWMWGEAFDFLAFFGSFWGNAKKNRTLKVKQPLMDMYF
jgi:hypothetical protein